MTLIVRGTTDQVPIPVLLRLVLQFIYDINQMSYSKEIQMKNSIVNWNKWVQEEKNKELDKYGITADTFIPVGKKGTIVDEVEFQLQSMAWMLHRNELGGFDKRKAMFKEHRINYRKFYKLPESYLPSDFKKAQEHLKKAMEDHPEDYL